MCTRMFCPGSTLLHGQGFVGAQAGQGWGQDGVTVAPVGLEAARGLQTPLGCCGVVYVSLDSVSDHLSHTLRDSPSLQYPACHLSVSQPVISHHGTTPLPWLPPP